MSAYTHNGKCSTSEPCRRCFEFGQTTEQARIIKLLEDASDCKCSPEYGVDYDNYCYCDALALIKGEK